MTVDESRDLVDLIRDPSVIVDGGRIVAANHAMSAISGYSAQELLEKSLFDIVCGERPSAEARPGDTISGVPRGISAAALRQKNGQSHRVNVAARRFDSGDRGSRALLVFELPAESSTTFASLSRPHDSLPVKCLDIAQTAIAVIGRTGRVALANRRCCQLLGYERLELIGAPWLNVFAALGDRHRAARYFERLIAGDAGLEESYEALMPTRGGMKRLMRWNGTTLVDSRNGRILGVVASGSDMTEQKRLADALEDMERRYRLVSENVTDAVWTYDLRSGRVTYAGQAIAQIIGFTNEEVMGMGLERLFLPGSYEMGMKELQRHLQIDAEMPREQPHTWSLELEQVNKKGEVVWVEVTSRIVRDSLDGRPISITGVTRDITQRKKAEETLRESERRYRSLFENSMDAICIVSRDGRIVDLNRAALDMFGYSRGDATGLSLQGVARVPDFVSFRQEIEQRGFVRNYPMTLRRADGPEMDCVLTFGLRRDAKGNITGYEGSIRDVTHYKRLQENLRLYINEVTNAQEKERCRLSREIHDGLLQDLLALGLRLEEAIRIQDHPLGSRLKQLMDIQSEVGRLARETRLVSHALGPGVLEQLGLVAAIRAMLQSLNAAGIETRFGCVGQVQRLDPDTEVALFRTAQEAINNAKRHSGARSLMVELEYQPQKVSLTIADDGRGFEVPRRLSDFAGAKRLGLIGMEQRANILGGCLIVESVPNTGTTIRVEIPLNGAGR